MPFIYTFYNIPADDHFTISQIHTLAINEQGGQNDEAHVLGPYRKLVPTQLLQRNGSSCIRQLHSNFISTTYATGKAMWHQEIKH